MTEEQRNYLKDEYKDRYNELKNRQNDLDREYQEKLENEQASGFDKFTHGLIKFLQRCFDSIMK